MRPEWATDNLDPWEEIKVELALRKLLEYLKKKAEKQLIGIEDNEKLEDADNWDKCDACQHWDCCEGCLDK